MGAIAGPDRFLGSKTGNSGGGDTGSGHRHQLAPHVHQRVVVGQPPYEIGRHGGGQQGHWEVGKGGMDFVNAHRHRKFHGQRDRLFLGRMTVIASPADRRVWH